MNYELLPPSPVRPLRPLTPSPVRPFIPYPLLNYFEVDLNTFQAV